MREIKFRAWDKAANKLTTDISLRYIMEWLGLDGIPTLNEVFSQTDKRMTLMQYTGRKDKNGKEGYHKDICRDKNGNWLQIEWIETDAMFALLFVKDGEFTGASMPMRYLEECEVIGNIWENGELLK